MYLIGFTGVQRAWGPVLVPVHGAASGVQLLVAQTQSQSRDQSQRSLRAPRGLWDGKSTMPGMSLSSPCFQWESQGPLSGPQQYSQTYREEDQFGVGPRGRNFGQDEQWDDDFV